MPSHVVAMATFDTFTEDFSRLQEEHSKVSVALCDIMPCTRPTATGYSILPRQNTKMVCLRECVMRGCCVCVCTQAKDS